TRLTTLCAAPTAEMAEAGRRNRRASSSGGARVDAEQLFAGAPCRPFRGTGDDEPVVPFITRISAVIVLSAILSRVHCLSPTRPRKRPWKLLAESPPCRPAGSDTFHAAGFTRSPSAWPGKHGPVW